MIDSIPIEPYKSHQGYGRGTEKGEEKLQYSHKGIALNTIEQALVLRVNKMIDMMNEFEKFGREMGLNFEAKDDKV